VVEESGVLSKLQEVMQSEHTANKEVIEKCINGSLYTTHLLSLIHINRLSV
jgi:hypothetical protein